MNTLFYSSLFLISIIFLTSGFYVYKKSDKEINGVKWFIITLFLYLCYNAFIAGIINLINIPVNMNTMTIINSIFGIIYWLIIIKQKKKQKYYYTKFDFFVVGALILTCIFVGYIRFGGNLQLNYDTSDPSIHFRFAMDIVNSSKVGDMYFSAINNALMIEFFSPFIKLIDYYKVFILSDILMFLLSGFIFYSIIMSHAKTNFMKIASLICTMLYLFAYPLNNMLFGFVYLGLGVSIIGFIIICMEMLINKEINRPVNFILLMLGFNGIFLCYVLFMPVTYLATFITLVIFFFKEKTLFKVKTILILFSIYAVPCIIGIIYTVFGVFSEGVTPGSAIANEGAIYRDFFSNYIFFIPLVIFAIYKIVKAKKLDVVSVLFILLNCFIIGLLYMGMQGKVSSYYYYKNYYFLWLIVMVLVYRGIAFFSQESKVFVAIYFFVWVLMPISYILNIEQRIQSKNSLYVPIVKSGSFSDIYCYNYNKLRSPRHFVNQEKLHLYKYAIDEFINKGEFVPLAGYWEDFYWYEGITNQRMEAYYNWQIGDDEYINKIETSKQIHHVVILTDSELYLNNKEFFDSYKKVFSNDAGFIIEVSK